MRVRWNKLFTQVAVWLVGELFLNLYGLDTLANYSEFLIDRQKALNINAVAPLSFSIPQPENNFKF